MTDSRGRRFYVGKREGGCIDVVRAEVHVYVTCISIMNRVEPCHTTFFIDANFRTVTLSFIRQRENRE